MGDILARLKQMFGDSLLNGMENRQPETQQRDISVFASWSELILRYRMNLNDVNPSNFSSSVFCSTQIPHTEIGERGRLPFKAQTFYKSFVKVLHVRAGPVLSPTRDYKLRFDA